MGDVSGTVQLNVRMDKSLRTEGTLALRSKGYTPARFIRAAWRMAARRGEDLERLVNTVEPADSQGDTCGAAQEFGSANSFGQPAMCAAHELWAEFIGGIGLDANSTEAPCDGRPYKDLLEDALREEGEL